MVVDEGIGLTATPVVVPGVAGRVFVNSVSPEGAAGGTEDGRPDGFTVSEVEAGTSLELVVVVEEGLPFTDGSAGAGAFVVARSGLVVPGFTSLPLLELMLGRVPPVSGVEELFPEGGAAGTGVELPEIGGRSDVLTLETPYVPDVDESPESVTGFTLGSGRGFGTNTEGSGVGEI